MASTIKDVAKLAGVSPSTVSGVLNNRITVRPQTYQRIMEAIEQVKYRPNAIARSLRKRETKTLGFLLPSITSLYYPQIARGAEEEAHENGYHIFLCNTERDPERQSSYIHSAVDKAMDGLIFCNLTVPDEDIELLNNEAIAVSSSVPVDSPLVDVVLLDYYHSARNATNYLLSLGHRRIALLNGPDSFRSRERARGFVRAFLDSGLTHDESLVINGDLSARFAYSATNELLDRDNPPTCIFSTGYMAAVVINAAIDRGLQVPRDLSVAGSDNSLSPVYPSMTAVKHYGFELGRQLVKMVISRKTNYDTLKKRSLTLPHEMIYGSTTRSIL